MQRKTHNYSELSDEELIKQLTSTPQENELVEFFMYRKCRKLLYYISVNFFQSTDIESIFGEFYEFLSDNNWRVLRSLKNKNNCTLNTYLTSCAVNYFAKKANEEKKRISHEFVPCEPEIIEQMNHFTAEEEIEMPPVWEAYKMLGERERTILRLLVIEEKAALVAAPLIWKYIQSQKSLAHATDKNVQSTISMAKGRALSSLVTKLNNLDSTDTAKPQ